jgi:hypothetical protein
MMATNCGERKDVKGSKFCIPFDICFESMDAHVSATPKTRCSTKDKPSLSCMSAQALEDWLLTKGSCGVEKSVDEVF